MRNKKITSAVVILCLAALTTILLVGCTEKYVLPDYADVYITTGTMSKLMSRQTSLKFEEIPDDNFGVTVEVDVNDRRQEVYGYGAALTHSAAYVLNQEGARKTSDKMLEEMYGESGARYGLVRIPIGASDYIEGDEWFTCCDLDDNNSKDMTLSNFSIEKDANIIAVLKRIIKLNPDVKVFAVPWSAPAWMKDTKSLTMDGTLSEDCYEVYADYLVKFVEAYKAEGIEIDYLSLINEPMITQIKYPHMLIDEYQALEIGAMVNKKLAAKGLKTSLLGWDHNVDYLSESYIDTIFEEGATRDVFAGVAFHGYSDVNLATISEGTDYVKQNYSDKQIFMTEITEHSGSNDFASNLSYAARYVTVDPLNYGLNGAMFWNLALQSDGKPTPISHGNECYGVMDLDYTDGEFAYFKHSAYYAMAHVSKFAYPVDGKYPVALGTESSNDSQIMASALYRADGAVVVVAVNLSDQLSETVKFVVDGKCVSVELSPQSVVTIVC